MQIYLHI
jgi:Mg2+/Co2+ transporter CorC